MAPVTGANVARAMPLPAASYYEHTRPEVARLVPAGAREVLDIGCASGAFGAALKAERPWVRVRGIEPVAEQAERARARLDDVSVGGADAGPPAGWPRPDCVVFADVLEHVVDPWTTLRRYRDFLLPGGVLVLSLPNVAHGSVLRGLLRQRWDYADDGILDRTHLRFFTRETAIELIEGSGFVVTGVSRVLDDEIKGRAVGRAIGVERGPHRLFRGALAVAADAVTRQFLITAE